MEAWVLAVVACVLTSVLILWRPGGVHEAVPALVGAAFLLAAGLVGRDDILTVTGVVWNAALTIVSTFIIASILEGAGFFRWVAQRLWERARNSGRRLFHLVLAFSACLTLFLNNVGSILIGTPVVIWLMFQLRLPRRVAGGYLLGACLVASASSAPVAVSNLANLEAIALVGVSLPEHLQFVFVPALVGLAACWGLLYAVFRRDIPTYIGPDVIPFDAKRGRMPADPTGTRPATRPAGRAGVSKPQRQEHLPEPGQRPDFPFIRFAVAIVVLVRMAVFAASLFAIPASVVSSAGAAVLLVANARRRAADTRGVVGRAPWAVIAFAFGMDLVVFGVRNAGVTGILADWLAPLMHAALFASFLPGLVTAALASLLNNHPGLMIGTLTLLDIPGLDWTTLRVTYASVMLGSDLGALLTPVGTLASLLWFHILRQHGLVHS